MYVIFNEAGFVGNNALNITVHFVEARRFDTVKEAERISATYFAGTLQVRAITRGEIEELIGDSLERWTKTFLLQISECDVIDGKAKLTLEAKDITAARLVGKYL